MESLGLLFGFAGLLIVMKVLAGYGHERDCHREYVRRSVDGNNRVEDDALGQSENNKNDRSPIHSGDGRVLSYRDRLYTQLREAPRRDR